MQLAGSSFDPSRNVPMQDLPKSTDLRIHLDRALIPCVGLWIDKLINDELWDTRKWSRHFAAE